MIVHSEKTIQELLSLKYSNTSRYKLSNAYIFRHDWESDFFVVKKPNGYCYEIEIKITRSDFFADFKKIDKHSILKSGEFKHRRTAYLHDEKGGLLRDGKGFKQEITYETKTHNFRPNRYFYCVPEGLVAVSEVPEYAGLMYAKDRNLTIIKEAPFIHKEVLKFESCLCDKFYWYWIQEKQETQRLKREIQTLKESLTNPHP